MINVRRDCCCFSAIVFSLGCWRPGAAEYRHARLVAAIGAMDPRAARAALAADISGAAEFIESRGVLAADRVVHGRGH